MASASSAREPSIWLESPGWDFLWILNGLWLLALLLLALAIGESKFLRLHIATGALLFLWGGHILSPIITAWSSPILRGAMRAEPRKYVIEPVLVVVACVLCAVFGLRHAMTSLPESWRAHLDLHIALVYVFIVWNTWHFSAQHFGVLSIYRMQLRERGAHVRRRDRWFCVALTCVLLPLAWYTQSKRLGPVFGYLPPPQPLGLLAAAVICTAIAITLAVVLSEWRSHRPSPARIGYMITIGLQPVLAAVSYPIFNMALFSVSHWVIALALSSRILAGLSQRGSTASRAWPVPISFALPLAGFALLSLPMYLIFWSDVFVGEAGFLFTGAFRRDSAGDLPLVTSTTPEAVVAGLYFGVSFVHFLYDRYLYSFRKPIVRNAISPHLFTSIHSGSGQEGRADPVYQDRLV